jgi:hypothetical protein
MIPVIALCVALAFFEINGRPLIHAMEHATSYLFASKLYLWKQREQTQQTEGAAVVPLAQNPNLVPKLSQSKLKDLAWSLNIKDRSQMDVSSSAGRSGFEI